MDLAMYWPLVWSIPHDQGVTFELIANAVTAIFTQSIYLDQSPSSFTMVTGPAYERLPPAKKYSIANAITPTNMTGPQLKVLVEKTGVPGSTMNANAKRPYTKAKQLIASPYRPSDQGRARSGGP